MRYTPNGLVYPEGGDLVRDGDNVIGVLAQTLDPIPTAISPTPATNWSLVPGRAVQAGPLVYWVLNLTRTAVPITADSTGKIANIAVFSGMPANFSPYDDGNATRGRVEIVWNDNQNLYGYMDNLGNCVLTHGWPGQTYPVGAGYQFRGFYLSGF